MRPKYMELGFNAMNAVIGITLPVNETLELEIWESDQNSYATAVIQDTFFNSQMKTLQKPN